MSSIRFRPIISVSIFIALSGTIARGECEPVTKGKLTATFGDQKISIQSIDTNTPAKASAKTIDLSDFLPNECKRMELADGRRAVTVTFTEKSAGTSTIVFDTLYGVFNLETAQWIVKPFAIVRNISTKTGPETTELQEVSLKKKDGKTVLVKKDVASKKTEEIPL